MQVILSHPTGNANVRAIATALAQQGLLNEFHTAIASFPGSMMDWLGNFSALKELHRRRFDSSLAPFTNQWPWLELGRQAALKTGFKSLTKHETGLLSVDGVYRSLDSRLASRMPKAARKGTQAIYGYEDGALSSFSAAKRVGLKCVYELPIAFWETSRSLLQQEAERLPEWTLTLGGGIQASEHKTDRKTQELELADLVITPSQFVRDSLPVAFQSKSVIAPFGSPNRPFALRMPTSYAKRPRPLRVLFAGSMGQRKGLGDLFAAVKLLNRRDLELVVMGSPIAPLDFYRQQLPNFTYEPGRPNDQVMALMRTCDVFCLPSIVEGRALVMQEAMSQGLPLLITPNTGGADLVIEGKTGFLIPIRSPEAIAEKLSWFLDNRTQIPGMGNLAQEHAHTYTWEGYSRTIIEAIRQVIA